MGSLWSWSGHDGKNSLVLVNYVLKQSFYQRYFNDIATNINLLKPTGYVMHQQV